MSSEFSENNELKVYLLELEFWVVMLALLLASCLTIGNYPEPQFPFLQNGGVYLKCTFLPENNYKILIKYKILTVDIREKPRQLRPEG